jgi:hypothetical protein
VSNNTAPPDTTVENVTVENYINRTSIVLLGREPDTIEHAWALAILKQSSFSIASRKVYLDSLIKKPEYFQHTFDKWRIELLNTVDTTDVNNEIVLFNTLLTNSSFQSIWPVIRVEINRMVKMQDTTRLYLAGQLPLKALHAALIDNYFYDQVNMGAANFVISTFQHFINRNPEVAEQNSGVAMVNGQYANLFLQSGSSKDEYISILMHSNDYAEGMVSRMYTDILLRSAVSVEQSNGTQLVQSSNDVQEEQMVLLSSDEYAGIKH